MQQVDTMPLGACVKLNGEEQETSLAGASDLLRWVPDRSDLEPSHCLRKFLLPSRWFQGEEHRCPYLLQQQFDIRGSRHAWASKMAVTRSEVPLHPGTPARIHVHAKTVDAGRREGTLQCLRWGCTVWGSSPMYLSTVLVGLIGRLRAVRIREKCPVCGFPPKKSGARCFSK